MKVTINLDLSKEEDKYKLNNFSNASKYKSVVLNMAQHLRQVFKYSDYEHLETTKLIEDIHSHFWDLCSEEGVDPFTNDADVL